METNDKTSPVTPEKDRNSVSLDLMHRMRLHGMAAAFSESLQATFAETMTPDSFLNWLLSREWDYRVARNIERLVKGANFRYNDASVAQIDYTLPRGLDRNQMERLASLDFVRKGDNLFITGCAGTGKSYLATALGYEACKAGMNQRRNSTVGANNSISDLLHLVASANSLASLRIHFNPPNPTYLRSTAISSAVCTVRPATPRLRTSLIASMLSRIV
nr:ATP-binding protein [Muribaculum intestinale]